MLRRILLLTAFCLLAFVAVIYIPAWGLCRLDALAHVKATAGGRAWVLEIREDRGIHAVRRSGKGWWRQGPYNAT